MKDDLLSFRASGWFSALCALVAACGVALIFSMPSATYVRELIQSPFRRPTPLVFYAIAAFSISFYALQQGAAAVPLRNWGLGSLARLGRQVGVGLLFVLPYFVYLRVLLLPGDRLEILWVGLYCVLLALFFSLVGHWLELVSLRRGRETLAARVSFILCLFLLPVPFRLLAGPVRYLMYLSPFSAVEQLHTGALPPEVWTFVLVPAIGALIASVAIGFNARRLHV